MTNLKKSDYIIHAIGYIFVSVLFFTVLGNFISYLATLVSSWPGMEWSSIVILSIPYDIGLFGLLLFIFGLVKKDKPIQVVREAASLVKK